MAKDPATLWYWNDWYSGTVLLNRFLKGCYMDLLHAQFNHGRLSLESIKTILNGDFEKSWLSIEHKFLKDENGLFYNGRLEAEIEKRKKHSEKQKTNASMRWHKSGICQTDAKSMPLENENENRNEDVLIFNIEEFLLKNSAQLENVCLGVYKTKEQVLPILKSYHLWNQENGKYPKRPLQLIAGLQRWILNEKNHNHATANNHPSGNKQKLGTSDARIERARNW